MADPVTLVILLAAGDASTPAASAMAQGAHDAFAGAVTEIRETPSAPTDTDALAAENQSHPDAVAELLWRDQDHRRATLRVHLRQSHRWIERSFTFAASDPLSERGRTLGFAVASILPELAAPATTAPAGSGPSPATQAAGSTSPANAITSPSEASGTPAGASATATSTPAAAPAATSPVAAPSRTSTGGPAATSEAPGSPPSHADAVEKAPHADRASPQNPVLGLDLVGVGAAGIGGNANAAGGGGAVEWFAHRRLSLRLGAVARGGSLDVAAANVTTLLTSAGVVFQALTATGSEPLSVTIRADYILVRESANHYDGDEMNPVTDHRWLSGVDTFVDGSLLLSSQIAGVVGLGLEDVLAPTYVYVKDSYRATLPSLRAVLEGGFQLRF